MAAASQQSRQQSTSCSSDNDQLGPSMASDASGTWQASKDPSSAYGAPAIARLSEDVASTAVLSATHGIPLSLSNISLYRDDSASAGMTKQAATDRNTGMDTPTSDGMPLREIAVPGAATRPQAIPAQALEAASQSPNMPSAPSLQSWAALESKTASLDAESGAAALAAGLRAGPPLSQQAKDSDDSGNGQRGRPHSTDAQASGEENAPAFWEARRGSSFNSDHVHGSSAALSALAQAYSRQGSPGPVGSAQDAQMAAIERSPLETSRLLRDMATKIDSHDNLAELALPLEGQPQEPAPGPGPAPGSSPRGQGSKAEKIRTYRGPQHRTVLLDWPSPRHSAPVNPFAQAAEQAGDFGDPALESSSRSASPWSPAAAAAGSEAKSPKSVANLSTRCEAGSCQLPPGAARQEERPADPDGGMAFSSDNSKAARKDSASTTASARAGGRAMAGASSSGALTPQDKSQHRAASVGPAERAHSHTSLRCQPGTPVAPESPGEGAQRGQPLGPVSASAPTSGSMIKSSALEDSARESYSPAELDVIERAWATMGVGSGNMGKPKQLQHLQRQTFAGRDSAASASQVEGPSASGKLQGRASQARLTSRRFDVDVSDERHASNKHIHSRSGRSGLAQQCSPATATDDPSLGSAGLAASRLTATNLTEFDALQRQISRKDRPRSGVHERTHEWLAAAELPLEYEYSAKRAAKWKERCEAYASRAHREPPEAHSAPRQPDKQPNIFKRFLACITIEPW